MNSIGQSKYHDPYLNALLFHLCAFCLCVASVGVSVQTYVRPSVRVFWRLRGCGLFPQLGFPRGFLHVFLKGCSHEPPSRIPPAPAGKFPRPQELRYYQQS